MAKSIGAAAIITNEKGEVLLVKHSYGKNNWDLPGGKGEAQESAQQTAEREVLEEIGLQVKACELTGIYYEAQYDMHHFVFKAVLPNNQLPTPSSPEILECGFFALDQLPRPISDFTCERIKHALQREGVQRTELFHTVGPRVWYE